MATIAATNEVVISYSKAMLEANNVELPEGCYCLYVSIKDCEAVQLKYYCTTTHKDFIAFNRDATNEQLEALGIRLK